MTAELTNHLWQSTLFAMAAGLFTAAFRVNRAEVRYWLWFAASFKFFVPFALLMGLGGYVHWTPAANTMAAPAVSFAMEQFAQPFLGSLSSAPRAAGTSTNWMPLVLLSVWVCGFAFMALLRFRGWLRVRAAVRSSSPVQIPAPIEIRSCPGLLEPGVVGLFRPILLLPESLLERLTLSQIDALLAHELCHVRRRDNLTSAIHMIVEAIFWFHPLVWWIGTRLIEERERACDEAVLNLRCEPRVYAETILNVCKLYTESPLVCVSGITGSNIKRRIEAILANRPGRQLSRGKRLLLASAGTIALAAPVALGVFLGSGNVSVVHAQPSTAAASRFASASIKPCAAFRSRPVPETPGRLQLGCTTLQSFMQGAYGPYANGHMNPLSSVSITSGPAWLNSSFYEIDAQAAGHASQAMMKGPMLQALLEDKFKLKFHHETREMPAYELTVASGGSKLKQFQGTCIPWDSDDPPAHRDPEQMCGRVDRSGTGFDLNAATTTDLCMFFLTTLNRQVVIDKTGLSGRFDFNLQDVHINELGRRARGLPGSGNPAAPAPPTPPAFLSAVTTSVNKLGLSLQPVNRPGDFIVIDQAEPPSKN